MTDAQPAIGVCVSVASPIEGGRLHPRYDADSDILEVQSEAPPDWPYGVDIDGTIIFDLDPQRRLANFDVLVGRQRWERGPVQRWPDKAAAGTIVFSKETVERKSLNIPLRFIYDEDQRTLKIVIGSTPPEMELGLSKDCIALLSKMNLVGFLIRRF